MRETCPKEERLQSSLVVDELAGKLLTKEEFAKADEITELLVLGTKSKRTSAISELLDICSPPPYRPLFYLCFQLKFLPSMTRPVVFNASALVELLCKAMLYDKIERKMPIRKPLGPVINQLLDKKVIDRELFDVLLAYNEEFFSPAKHNWNVKNKRHLFTTKEAVYCIFITFSLAKILKHQNSYVDEVAKDKVNFDFIY